MGKAIDQLAQEQQVDVVARIGKGELSTQALEGADVAIEFSSPQSAVQNINTCFDAGVPVVVGTTAWYDHYPQLSERAMAEGKGLFTATNFSIGVNILFHINRELAKIMNDFPEYRVLMEETHHLQKKDHPSGTALSLAEDIVDALDRKNAILGQLADQQSSASDVDLQIISHREEGVPGFHEISYRSDIDEIKISHNALNRKGFALGALTAAKWMVGRKGVYTMKELLNFERK